MFVLYILASIVVLEGILALRSRSLKVRLLLVLAIVTYVTLGSQGLILVALYWATTRALSVFKVEHGKSAWSTFKKWWEQED